MAMVIEGSDGEGGTVIQFHIQFNTILLINYNITEQTFRSTTININNT